MLSSAGLFVGAPGKGKGLRRRRSTKSCLESASSGFSSAFDVFRSEERLLKRDYRVAVRQVAHAVRRTALAAAEIPTLRLEFLAAL